VIARVLPGPCEDVVGEACVMESFNQRGHPPLVERPPAPVEV
jgi:hypothetical protein